jgi:prevent-host-death family protein
LLKVVKFTTFLEGEMKRVTAAEANRQFSRLLGQVKNGDTVVITSHGEAVARIEPVTEQEAEWKALAREEARKELWHRLRTQPAMNFPKMTRDEIYAEILT